MRKTIYTLNIGQKYNKDIINMTYPLIKGYANKIKADFYEITERKFLDFPITYEKCQVYELGQEHKNDWNIFVDCDTVIHPDTPDWTNFLHKDTCAHNGSDLAPIRWRTDRVFWRDGRHIGSCTWFCVASDWTIEMFKPLEDITLEEAVSNIFPTHSETVAGYKPERLIEDYLFSRNIARFGLKFTTFNKLLIDLGLPSSFLWHMYMTPEEEKAVRMEKLLKEDWKLI
jgi:hypothetical protein